MQIAPTINVLEFCKPGTTFFWGFFGGVLHLEGGSAIGGTAIFQGGATFSRKCDGTIFQICFKVI